MRQHPRTGTVRAVTSQQIVLAIFVVGVALYFGVKQLLDDRADRHADLAERADAHLAAVHAGDTRAEQFGPFHPHVEVFRP